MKRFRKPLAVLLAALCVLCCFACCLCVFAEGDEPEHEHNYVPVTVIQPTCTEAGLVRYICSCGAVDEARDTVLAPAGHRWGPWVTVIEATTETEGLKERTCISDPTHKEYKKVDKLEPSPFAAFFQKIVARFKALYDRIFSLFYRD